jgi:hypothetical protein
VITARTTAFSGLRASFLRQDAAVLAALVLAGLVLAAGLSGRSGPAAAGALAALSVAWLLVNGPMEGPVLVAFTSSHGITGGDLAGFVGLALSAARLVALRRLRLAG